MQSKDRWIQKAKALFFDCTFCVDADSIRKEINDLIEEGGGFDYKTESSKATLRWPKKEVMCPGPGCWERRPHHERQDEMRGPQYIEVPSDWKSDDGIAFCSMECSMYAGLRSAKLCDKKGWELFIEHHSDKGAHFHTEAGDLILEMHPNKDSEEWLWVYRPEKEDSDKVREGMCWDILTEKRKKVYL